MVDGGGVLVVERILPSRNHGLAHCFRQVGRARRARHGGVGHAALPRQNANVMGFYNANLYQNLLAAPPSRELG